MSLLISIVSILYFIRKFLWVYFHTYFISKSSGIESSGVESCGVESLSPMPLNILSTKSLI